MPLTAVCYSTTEPGSWHVWTSAQVLLLGRCLLQMGFARAFTGDLDSPITTSSTMRLSLLLGTLTVLGASEAKSLVHTRLSLTSEVYPTLTKVLRTSTSMLAIVLLHVTAALALTTLTGELEGLGDFGTQVAINGTMLSRTTLSVTVMSAGITLQADTLSLVTLGFEATSGALALYVLGRGRYVTSMIATGPVKGAGGALSMFIGFGVVSGISAYVTGIRARMVVGSLVTALVTLNLRLERCWVIGVLIGGGIKVALIPGQTWLTKVHVESLTTGSVLLAGTGLKLGLYLHALLMVSVLLYLRLSGVFTGILGATVATTTTLFWQTDVKRWVAIFSIVHVQLFYLLLSGSCKEDNTSGVSESASESVRGLLQRAWTFVSAIPWVPSLALITSMMLCGMTIHSYIAGGLFTLLGRLTDLLGTRSFLDLTMRLPRSERMSLLILLACNGALPPTGLWLVELILYSTLIATSVGLAVALSALSSASLLGGMAAGTRIGIVGTNQGTRHDNTVGGQTASILMPICVVGITSGLNLWIPTGAVIALGERRTSSVTVLDGHYKRSQTIASLHKVWSVIKCEYTRNATRIL